jgi:hypothetical protein
VAAPQDEVRGGCRYDSEFGNAVLSASSQRNAGLRTETLNSNFKQLKRMRSCSRGASRPSFASTSPSKTEGAGKAGCRLHPRSCAQKTHEWTTGSTGSLRLSPREWVTAYFELSPVTGLFATDVLRIDDAPNPVGPDASPQHLTPAPGRQDHTTSPSAPVPAKNPAAPRAARPVWQERLAASFVRAPSDRSRENPPCDPCASRRCRVHRIPPRVRDDSRSAPRRVGRGELVEMICPTG